MGRGLRFGASLGMPRAAWPASILAPLSCWRGRLLASACAKKEAAEAEAARARSR